MMRHDLQEFLTGGPGFTSATVAIFQKFSFIRLSEDITLKENKKTKNKKEITPVR
jgi:hypothetical protein